MRRYSRIHILVMWCLWLFLPVMSTYATPPATSDIDPCCPGKNILTEDGCPGASNSSVKWRYTLLHCDEGSYIMNPNLSPIDNFTVNKDGELIITSSGDEFAIIEKGKFCLTSMMSSSGLDPIAQVCFTTQGKVSKFMLTASLTILSVGFLLLTVIVYSIIPELRDIQGKCIICTCCSLALGFFFLAVANLSNINIYELCTTIGYMMYFWILSAFFWMNVLSINVWKSIVFRRISIPESKQIIGFILYGWGIPLLLLIVSVITNHVEGEHIKPGIGVNSCWFKGKLATWIYFYGPIAVLLTTNVILFIWTSRTLWNESNYSNMTKVKALKFKFFLYLKVFLVMGIAWIFELISYVDDNDDFILWMITDIFNCLQGFFLFLVLVLFRKKAMKGLYERGLLCGCLPASWMTGPDEECEEFLESMDDNDPAATPMTH